MSSAKLPRPLFNQPFLFYNLVFFFVFSHIAFFYLYPLFLEMEGASKTKIGIIMGLFPVGTVLSRPLMGWLVARIGEKKVFLGGLAVISLSGALYLVVKEIGFSLFSLRFLHGVGFSAFIASSFTGITWRIPPERRGEAFGFVGAVILLAIATMPLAGEHLIKWMGYPLLFQVESVFAFCALFMTWIFFPEEIRPEENSRTRSFVEILSKKAFIGVLVVTVLFVQGQATVLNFIALIAEHLGVSSGKFLGVAATIAIFCRLFVAKSFDRYSKKKFLVISFLIFAFGLSFIPRIGTIRLFYLCAIFYGVGMGLLYPLLNVLAADQAADEEMPAAMGVFTGVFDAGFITGSMLSGWFADLFSLSWIFYFGSMAAILGAVVTLFLPLYNQAFPSYNIVSSREKGNQRF